MKKLLCIVFLLKVKLTFNMLQNDFVVATKLRFRVSLPRLRTCLFLLMRMEEDRVNKYFINFYGILVYSFL